MRGTGDCRLATPNKRTGVAAILERCLTDLSVWSAERLDYVAGADIDPTLPFVQRRPAPLLHDGALLDLDQLPDVTPDEQARYRGLPAGREAARGARALPAMRPPSPSHHAPLAGEALTQEATRRLTRADNSHLAPDHVIELAHGGTVLAKDLTHASNPACADPLEPDYGPNHAKIYWDADKPHWIICSLAHGFKHLYFPEPAPAIVHHGPGLSPETSRSPRPCPLAADLSPTAILKARYAREGGLLCQT